MLKFIQLFVDFTLIFIITIRKSAIQPIEAHFRGLYVQSDPIQAVFNKVNLPAPERPTNSVYYFPILILFLTASYGTVGLYYESNTVGQFNWRVLHNSSYVFTHRVCPRAIWSQMDFCFILDLIAANLIYSLLASIEQVDRKFRFYKVGNSIFIGPDELSSVESGKIIRLRHQIKFILHGIIMLYDVGWTSYFLIEAWLNTTESFNLRLFLYWMVVFPAGLYYIFYSVFTTVIYVILASRYIQIRQKVLIGKLVDIIKAIHHRKTKKTSLLLCFKHFQRANEQIVEMGQLIEEYSRVSVPILSVIIPFYITVQCYLLYIVLYADYSFLEKCIASTAIFECNLNMFVIINECSRVGKLCSRLEVLNRQFYLAYLRRGGFDLMNNAALFKAHSFQLSRRLHCYAFRLFGNYRITSKTFYLIISYISAYFVFMFKRQYSA